jgi:hypothetical protein
MAQDSRDRLCDTGFRPLTKQEIDVRLQDLAGEIAGPCLCGQADPLGDADGMHPRWIDPAELVRRLSRFISNN